MKATRPVRQEENKETITACNGQEEAWLLSVSGGVVVVVVGVATGGYNGPLDKGSIDQWIRKGTAW